MTWLVKRSFREDRDCFWFGFGFFFKHKSLHSGDQVDNRYTKPTAAFLLWTSSAQTLKDTAPRIKAFGERGWLTERLEHHYSGITMMRSLVKILCSSFDLAGEKKAAQESKKSVQRSVGKQKGGRELPAEPRPLLLGWLLQIWSDTQGELLKGRPIYGSCLKNGQGKMNWRNNRWTNEEKIYRG